MSPHKSVTPRSPKPDNSELIARLRTDAEEYQTPLEAALRRAHNALNRIEDEYDRATKHSSAITAKAKAAGEILHLWRACRFLTIAITVLEAQEA